MPLLIAPHTSKNSSRHIIMPIPPERSSESEEGAVYERFMNHVRLVPNSRLEIKILAAIQFTADMLNHSDAHISKILVDQGLRAPRMAFPVDFLSFIDGTMLRSGWQVGGPTSSLRDLKTYWDIVDDKRFNAFRQSPIGFREKFTS